MKFAICCWWTSRKQVLEMNSSIPNADVPDFADEAKRMILLVGQVEIGKIDKQRP